MKRKNSGDYDFRWDENSQADDGQQILPSRGKFPHLDNKEKMIKNIKLPSGVSSSIKGKYFFVS